MTTPVVPRTISVTYGALAMGLATDYWIHDVHTIEGDYRDLTVRFNVVVHADTAANLKTLSDALEAEFRKPNLDLTVVIGGSTTFASDHANATSGFNADPQFRILETHRSEISRAYECQVAFLMPADEAGKAGRQTSTRSVNRTQEGVLQVVAQATYTAIASGSTQTAAEAAFRTFLDTYLGTFAGITFDEYEITSSTDDEDKIVTVNAVVDEVIFNQSSGVLNDPDLVRPIYVVQSAFSSERQLSNAGALGFQFITVTLETGVRKANTTDLKDVIDNKLRPHINNIAQTLTDAVATPVPLGESFDQIKGTNRIRGQIVYRVQRSTLIRAIVRTRESRIAGRTFVPVMDGGPFSRDSHLSPAQRIRTISASVLEIAGGQSLVQAIVQPFRALAEGQGFVLVQEEEASEEFEERLTEDSGVIQFVETGLVLTLEFVRAGGGGGGTQTRRRPTTGPTLTRPVTGGG